MMRLKVWFYPAIDLVGGPLYEKEVETLEQGVFLLNEIASFTLMLGNSQAMNDWSNSGGIQMSEDGEWTDWYDSTTGIDDPEEYLEWKNEQ